MTAKARVDLDDKCPICAKPYGKHSQNDINECVSSVYPDYNGNLDTLLNLLAAAGLARRWGQPAADKKLWAFWPVDNKPPITSTVPTIDFAIYLLSNQSKPKDKSKDKKLDKKPDSFMDNFTDKTKDIDDDKKEGTVGIHITE